jgi:hypothetical protein
VQFGTAPAEHTSAQRTEVCGHGRSAVGLETRQRGEHAASSVFFKGTGTAIEEEESFFRT